MNSIEFGRRGATVVALVILTLMAIGGGAVAQQKLQQVEVANSATNPVPVGGTVDVGNLPATQDVSGAVAVTNLPDTQRVTGSVDVTATTPLPVSIHETSGWGPLQLVGQVEDVINDAGCSLAPLSLPPDALVRLDHISVSVDVSPDDRPGADVRLLHGEFGSRKATIAVPLTSQTAWKRAGGSLDLGGIVVDTRADAADDAITGVTLCVNGGTALFGPDASYVVTGERIG